MNTRFLNKKMYFINCFKRNSYSGVQGTAPELWNCDYGTEAPAISTDCFSGNGNNSSSLSNYDDIDSSWK